MGATKRPRREQKLRHRRRAIVSRLWFLMLATILGKELPVPRILVVDGLVMVPKN